MDFPHEIKDGIKWYSWNHIRQYLSLKTLTVEKPDSVSNGLISELDAVKIIGESSASDTEKTLPNYYESSAESTNDGDYKP